MAPNPARRSPDLTLEPGQSMQLCLPPGAVLRVSGGRLRLVAHHWLAGRMLATAVVLEEGAVHGEGGWARVDCLPGGQGRFCVAARPSPMRSRMASLKFWCYKALAPIHPLFKRRFS